MITESYETKAIAAAGDYTANDVISESASAGTVWTFKNVGGSGHIVKAIAVWETTGLTPELTLYLFNKEDVGCNLNDNVACDCPLWADIDNYIGRIDFPAMEDLGTGSSNSIATPSTAGNVPIAYRSDSSEFIYGVLVTRSTITGEAAGESLSIRLAVEP